MGVGRGDRDRGRAAPAAGCVIGQGADFRHRPGRIGGRIHESARRRRRQAAAAPARPAARVRNSRCMSAPAIGRVAPGRHQKRHMIMPFRFGDRKADRHDIEEGGIGLGGRAGSRNSLRHETAIHRSRFATARRRSAAHRCGRRHW